MRSPIYLYKYKPFGEFLLRELSQQEVYYCSPNNFNDPLDCDPFIIDDLETSEMEELSYNILNNDIFGRSDLARRRIEVARYMASQFGSWSDGNEGERYYRRSLIDFVQRFIDNYKGNIGIFSLSRKWNNVLMWSHYAKNHTGVCLEFEYSGNLCSEIMPVDYVKSPVISARDVYNWRVRGNEGAERRIRGALFFSKASAWRYEAEWRSFNSSAGTFPSPFQLKSILFGYRCDFPLKATIVKLLLGGDLNINFYDMFFSQNGEKLQRIKMDTSELEAFGVRKSSAFRDRDALQHFEILPDLGVQGDNEG